MHIPHLTGNHQPQHDFANRLEDLGCKIDWDGTYWLRAGYFTPTGQKKR